MISKNALRSAIYLDELPEQYKDKVIGRGKTAIVVQDEDPNKVLIFTRDYSKVEWLVHGIGAYIVEPGIELEEIKGKPYKLKGTTKTDVKTRPIVVIRITKLHKLSPKNKKLLKKELELFSQIRSKCTRGSGGLSLLRRPETLIKLDMISEYQRNHQDSILLPLMDFISNYDLEQYSFDLHNGNFMEDGEGNLVVTDPIIEKEVLDYVYYR